MCNYLLIDSKACRLSERAKRPFDPSFRLDRVKRKKKKVVENREGLCYSFSIEKTKRKTFSGPRKANNRELPDTTLLSRVVSDSYAISKSFKTLLGRTGWMPFLPHCIATWNSRNLKKFWRRCMAKNGQTKTNLTSNAENDLEKKTRRCIIVEKFGTMSLKFFLFLYISESKIEKLIDCLRIDPVTLRSAL